MVYITQREYDKAIIYRYEGKDKYQVKLACLLCSQALTQHLDNNVSDIIDKTGFFLEYLFNESFWHKKHNSVITYYSFGCKI